MSFLIPCRVEPFQFGNVVEDCDDGEQEQLTRDNKDSRGRSFCDRIGCFYSEFKSNREGWNAEESQED